MAALLFLAFAYFAVGQAVVNRGDAQSAADAAALAAVSEARQQISEDLLDDMEKLADWEDLLDGLVFPTASSCEMAASFAAKNQSTSEECNRLPLPRSGFTVKVKTTEAVGSSVIPGTESTRSTASATAVLEPRCVLETLPDDYSEGDVIELECKGANLEIDPSEEDPLPDLSVLFNVRLVK